MIPGCEASGRSGSKVHISHILMTFLGSFASMSGCVVSCGGWWILWQSYSTCSAVSSPIQHFPQMVSTVRPILCNQFLSSRWWPLLRRPIIVCSFLDNFYSSLRSSFSPFTPYIRQILSWEISPPLVARLMVAFTKS